MKTKGLLIDNNGVEIPALLWGEPSGRLLLCVHGIAASKEDPTIALAASIAAQRGVCALSFDLPEHGERAGQTDYPCVPWNGVSDLMAVYRYARSMADEVSLFACSLGAYLTLLALPELETNAVYLLSPVVRMDKLIEGMMYSAGVTKERLEREGHIAVPDGPALDWRYYTYALEQPVKHRLGVPMAILRGEHDTLCAREDVGELAEWYGATLTEMPEGEHWFHTPPQMEVLEAWLRECLPTFDAGFLMGLLTDKNAALACGAAEALVKESGRRNVCYPYLDELTALLENGNSLVRNRAIAVIAATARWDTEGKMAAVLDALLRHITDEKPITARQCVKALPLIAAAKPECIPRIREALEGADVSGYADSMRPLILKDIMETLRELEKEESK